MIALADKQLDPMDYGIRSERMWLFALNMYTFGSDSFGNGVESARIAKYKGNINQLGQRAHELVNNSKVQLAKRAIQAETAEKLHFDRDTALNMLITDYGYLTKKAQAGDSVAINTRRGIVSELASCSGMHSSTLNTSNKTLSINVHRRPDTPSKGPSVDAEAITADEPINVLSGPTQTQEPTQ